MLCHDDLGDIKTNKRNLIQFSKFLFKVQVFLIFLFNVQNVANFYIDNLCEPNFIYRRRLLPFFFSGQNSNC